MKDSYQAMGAILNYTTVRIMYIMLNKRFGKLLPYIRLWLLYVATTPFMLHYTELLKACSTASVAQAI